MTGHYLRGKPSDPNVWAKTRIRSIKSALGGCQWQGCTATAPSALDFAHLKDTNLNGWGRGRKERLKDVQRHPDAYTLLCDGGASNHHYHYDQMKKDGVQIPVPEPRSLAELAKERGFDL